MATFSLTQNWCSNSGVLLSAKVASHGVLSSHKGLRRPFRCTRGVRGGALITRALDEKLGVVIIDHGSRRQESNELLHKFVEVYKKQTRYEIVEPAHMELAPPSISEAFKSCVDQGATTVVLSPYFLSPGRHWNEDIPKLAREAAAQYPQVNFMVTAPIGVHSLVAEVLQERMEYCILHAAGKRDECEICAGSGRCKMFVMGDDQGEVSDGSGAAVPKEVAAADVNTFEI